MTMRAVDRFASLPKNGGYSFAEGVQPVTRTHGNCDNSSLQCRGNATVRNHSANLVLGLLSTEKSCKQRVYTRDSMMLVGLIVAKTNRVEMMLLSRVEALFAHDFRRKLTPYHKTYCGNAGLTHPYIVGRVRHNCHGSSEGPEMTSEKSTPHLSVDWQNCQQLAEDA